MGRGGGGLGVVWNDDESLETREVMIAQHREYIKCHLTKVYLWSLKFKCHKIYVKYFIFSLFFKHLKHNIYS